MGWVFEKSIISPRDKKSLARYKEYKPYYRVKYDIAKQINPARILEIGVRAGYSAYAFLCACPNAEYLGIDAENNKHGGKGGPWIPWAEKILSSFKVELKVADTQKMDRIEGGPFDLIHVDGDHSMKGALHDMRICWLSLSGDGVLFVDDYDYLTEVRKAVDVFISEVCCVSKYVKSLRGEMLLSRKVINSNV